MAGTTSQLRDRILEGARLQDSSERLRFGAASFQPHLVQTKRCAPHGTPGRGVPQPVAQPPLVGDASSRRQRRHRLSPAAVQAARMNPRSPSCLPRLFSASRSPQVGAQKPLAPALKERSAGSKPRAPLTSCHRRQRLRNMPGVRKWEGSGSHPEPGLRC